MNLLVFYSRIERKASDVLGEQKKTITRTEDDAVRRMHRIKQLGPRHQAHPDERHHRQVGDLLHEHWMNKRIRRPSTSTTKPREEGRRGTSERQADGGGKNLGVRPPRAGGRSTRPWSREACARCASARVRRGEDERTSKVRERGELRRSEMRL